MAQGEGNDVARPSDYSDRRSWAECGVPRATPWMRRERSFGSVFWPAGIDRTTSLRGLHPARTIRRIEHMFPFSGGSSAEVLPPPDDRLPEEPGERATVLRALDTAEDHVCQLVESFAGFLAGVAPSANGRTQIERIAWLEKLQAAAAGALAAESVAFAEVQRVEQLAAGVKRRDLGRGIAEQLGFARRISPTAAGRALSRAYALRDRLPQTLRQLRAGEVSEAQATVVATRTSHLSEQNVEIVDAGLAPQLPGWNRKQTEQAADQAAYTIDPQGLIDRRNKAEKDRRVSVRPAPDNMAYLTGLLPLAQAVACYAALRKAAAEASGKDRRNQGQIMADTLVKRVTGQEEAHLIPIEIELSIPVDSLLNQGDKPAWLNSYGPIPAEYARKLLANVPSAEGNRCGDEEQRAPVGNRWYDVDPPPPPVDITSREYSSAKAWIRRIFTDPKTGKPVATDLRRRTFNGTLRRLIIARDKACQHPYCAAPVRHIDHEQPWRDGGETSEENGQGLCASGNYTKEMPGWMSKRRAGGERVVTTPTGLRYVTRPPAETGYPPTALRES